MKCSVRVEFPALLMNFQLTFSVQFSQFNEGDSSWDLDWDLGVRGEGWLWGVRLPLSSLRSDWFCLSGAILLFMQRYIHLFC